MKINLVCPECGCDSFREDKEITDYYKATLDSTGRVGWEIIETCYGDTENIICNDCGFPVELDNSKGVVSLFD